MGGKRKAGVGGRQWGNLEGNREGVGGRKGKKPGLEWRVERQREMRMR